MTTGEWIASGLALIGLLIQVIVAVYFYGGLSQSVKAHDKQLEDLGEEQNDQWDTIGRLREDVGRVKGHLGINGSTRI